MILCAVATGFPLVAGLLRGEIGISVYGALTGYLLALNDHLGPLKHRLWIVTFTFLTLMGGFGLGYALQGHLAIYLALVAVISYWIGILGGEGAEFEKGVLFSALALVIAYSAQAILPGVVPAVALYVGIAYLFLLAAMVVLHSIAARPPEPILGFRMSARKSLNPHRGRHIHAACYAAMVVVSVVIGLGFRLERAYWITVTVLLVMKSNRTEAFYRTFQRLLGTAFGVLYVDVFIHFIHDPQVMILMILLCAFAVPWGLFRNYGIVAFFATVMVVLFIELAMSHHGSPHLAFVRFRATILGCVIALIGTGLSKVIDTT